MVDLGCVEAAPESLISQSARRWVAQERHRIGARWRAACDWLKWLGHESGSLERHAEDELRRAGWLDKKGFYSDMMGRAVLRMIREFSEEGHSGMSAPVAIGLFEKVARLDVLSPLTGDDDEWIRHDYDDGPSHQNKRCSHVFKGADGRAYDIRGRVFRDPSGCYTNRDSRVYIEFPYTPKVEYVDAPGSMARQSG